MAARNGHNLLEEALRIAQATTRSHPARLTCLLRLVADAFCLSSATLYLPEHNPGYLTRRYSTLPLSGYSCRIPFGTGCAGSAALNRTRATLSPELLHEDEPRLPEEREIVALPLKDGGKLAAVLSVGCSSGPVPPAALRGLKPLLPVLGWAASAAAQAQTAERDRRNLSLLTALGKLLAAPVDPAFLLPRVLKQCTGSGLAVCAVARLVDADSGKTRSFKSCRREAGSLLSAFLEQEALLAERLRPEQETLVLPATAGFSYHAICAPLNSNGRTLGSCTFFGPAELAERDQREFVETLTALLSAALSEAISTDRIANFIFENEKKLKELSLLFRMSNTMLSTIKLNKLIHLTLTALTSGPDRFFDRAMLFLTNERSGVLQGMLGVTWEHSPPLSGPGNGADDVLSSRWDISEEDMSAQRGSDFSKEVQGRRLELDPCRNVASRAVLEKRLVYIRGEDLSPQDELLCAHGSAGFAASPLIAHGKAVGVVLVDNALTHGSITEEDLRFLQLFTNQAGMAIENSILYNKVEDAHRQLYEAQESLLQKERLAAIGEMAAGIAHELKGPLVAIGGFAGRLTRKLAPDTEVWGHADLIQREVLRLEAILSEILLFSKKATLCYARCNMAQIVKDSLAVVAPRIEEKGIELVTRFSRRKLLLVGDGQQLKQVFINIFMNSLDAMGPGGKLVVQAAPDHFDGREAICVRITDTGGGIPVEALHSIFTPFYTTKEGGTGLGLPIANRIITNHGGKIHLVNRPGQGAEFKILLPTQCDYSV